MLFDRLLYSGSLVPKGSKKVAVGQWASNSPPKSHQRLWEMTALTLKQVYVGCSNSVTPDGCSKRLHCSEGLTSPCTSLPGKGMEQEAGLFDPDLYRFERNICHALPGKSFGTCAFFSLQRF